MVLSRFWYVVLSVALVGAMFLVYLATAVSNRTARTTAGRLLTAASQSVGWYLQDDARSRAAALIPLSFHPDVKDGLTKASKAESLKEVPTEAKDKAKKALASFRAESTDLPFDALWAIDAHGRVLANDNFERGTGTEHFEMGGYSLVADALHGWIRDDAWIFDGQIYRVVARPVEIEVDGTPVGAVVGAKVVDDRFAQAISDRTGAALAFYAGATRVATGAPPAFDKATLEIHSADIEQVEKDEDYNQKGRTAPRVLRENPGFDTSAIFARMPGDAWELGAGFVVGHRQATVTDPFEFQRLASQDDKDAVPLVMLILAAAGAALLGLIFTILEHTVPLFRFRRAVMDLGDKKSSTDVLKPSTFRGVYKKIAAHVNDALDKVAAHAGVDRGPADLEGVLGPLPAQPQMSAFAVPKSGEVMAPDSAAAAPVSSPRAMPQAARSLPKRAVPSGPSAEGNPSADDAAPPPESAIAVASSEDEEPTRLQARFAAPAGAPAGDGAGAHEDEETQWRRVYQDFVALKRQLGEAPQKLTYEKFRGTLQRNKDALMARHGCQRVKFRVYEKQGRAALKASQVK